MGGCCSAPVLAGQQDEAEDFPAMRTLQPVLQCATISPINTKKDEQGPPESLLRSTDPGAILPTRESSCAEPGSGSAYAMSSS